MTAFDCSLEWIVITPDLEMMTCYLLRTEFLYEDSLLSFVSVPPDVIGLDKDSVEPFSAVAGLSGACGPVVPF